MIIDFIYKIYSVLDITYVNSFNLFGFDFYINSILCSAFVLFNCVIFYFIFRKIKSFILRKEVN